MQPSGRSPWQPASDRASERKSAAPTTRRGPTGGRGKPERGLHREQHRGTVSIVDADSFEHVPDTDILPDGEQADPSEDPVQGTAGQRLVEAAAGENYVQDLNVLADGRTLYASHGHRGDIAAFDLESGELTADVHAGAADRQARIHNRCRESPVGRFGDGGERGCPTPRITRSYE